MTSVVTAIIEKEYNGISFQLLSPRYLEPRLQFSSNTENHV